MTSMPQDPSKIQDTFSATAPDPSWSFADKNRRHTRYATHAYHAYPAKFIPHLASRLIQEFSGPGDWVCDPFMGSGTTLVEAKLQGRPSCGVDISPVAHLIAKAKTTAIPTDLLRSHVRAMERREILGQESEIHAGRERMFLPTNSRIDYWFTPAAQLALREILSLIESVENPEIQNFLRCGFSNILKTVSIWSQKSTKPIRDFSKRIRDPWGVFVRKIRGMARNNASFYGLLEQAGYLSVACEPSCSDARNLPVDDRTLALVVTSPPYVTSYEYADLHQLSGLWFRYIESLCEFRKGFIGTAYFAERSPNMDSPIASETVRQLEAKKPKLAQEIAAYFTDMREVFEVLHRKLKPGGRACIVIGNTSLLEVPVLNAQVFAEQMVSMGFQLEKLVDRIIPSKILPQARDKSTGRFAGTQSADSAAYPHEYILIMRKR